MKSADMPNARKINYTFKDREQAAREFWLLAHWYSEIVESLMVIDDNANKLWHDPAFIVTLVDDLSHAHSQLRELTEVHLANWLYATWPERIEAELCKHIKAVLTLIAEETAEIGFGYNVAAEFAEKYSHTDSSREQREPYAAKLAWVGYRAVHCDKASGFKDDGVQYLDRIAEMIQKLPGTPASTARPGVVS
jgi:hypothetical protein